MATDQWRVAWLMWPPDSAQPRRVERNYDNKRLALQHFAGLVEIEANHHIRPCGEHIYHPRLQQRRVVMEEWRDAEEKRGAD